MGNEQTKKASSTENEEKSYTTAKDSAYLISAPVNVYPDALDLTIYGFIREFIENNLWIEWAKSKVIPTDIKLLLIKYLKSALIVESGTTVTLYSDVYHEFEHILIRSNGVLTVEGWNRKNNKGGKLLIKTDNDITIEAKGQINVNCKGYQGGYFCEQGESYTGKGEKNNTAANGGGGGGGKGSKSSGYSKCRGGGAGYGTKGNDVTDGKKVTNGGNIYGDKYLTMLYLGSGGGGGYNNGISDTESGGNGGGVIDVQCGGNIIMAKESVICANGGNSVFGGGGSGGTIKLKCKGIQGHLRKGFEGGCCIKAIGGYNKDRKYAGYGRIRVSVSDNKEEAKVLNGNVSPKPVVDSEFKGNFVE